MERTAPWKRRLDKGRGGYAFVRRHEKSLERRGFKVIEKLVGAFRLPERGHDGKYQLNIYRDIRVKISKKNRRPDNFSHIRDESLY